MPQAQPRRCAPPPPPKYEFFTSLDAEKMCILQRTSPEGTAVGCHRCGRWGPKPPRVQLGRAFHLKRRKWHKGRWADGCHRGEGTIYLGQCGCRDAAGAGAGQGTVQARSGQGSWAGRARDLHTLERCQRSVHPTGRKLRDVLCWVPDSTEPSNHLNALSAFPDSRGLVPPSFRWPWELVLFGGTFQTKREKMESQAKDWGRRGGVGSKPGGNEDNLSLWTLFHSLFTFHF